MPYVKNRGFLIPSNMVCLLLIVLSTNCEMCFPIYHYEELVDFGKVFNRRKIRYGCTQICLRKFSNHASHLRVYVKPKLSNACDYQAYQFPAPQCYESGTFLLVIQNLPSGVPKSPMSLELLCRLRLFMAGYVKKNKWSENAIENGAFPLVPRYPEITRAMCKKAFFPRLRPIFWLNRRYMLDSTCSSACQPGALYHRVYHSATPAWPGLMTEVCDVISCPFYNDNSDDDLPSPSGEPYF